MATYTFKCYKDDGGCDYLFEIICSVNDYTGKNPSCPKCRKRKPVSRCYDIDLAQISFQETQPRTLGALADKNSRKLSTDEKTNILKNNTEYLRQGFTGKLPQGASSMRNKDGSVNVSTKQYKKDPRK